MDCKNEPCSIEIGWCAQNVIVNIRGGGLYDRFGSLHLPRGNNKY